MILKPTDAQRAYNDLEVGIFFHFGIRTFNEENRDWDMKQMELSTFNPAQLDCEAWMQDVVRMGGRYTVMTTKHHDGFCLWRTKYSDYAVQNTPFKDGKGDVVREYCDACRKYGIKVGLYYSCAQFGSRDMDSKAYNDFVCGQLEELLVNYGQIDILWFDSCGSENYDFDVARIQKTIYSLQPYVLVFGSWGKDIRWIGNEWGLSPMPNDNTVEGFYAPGECDCCITRKEWENFWFYNETNRQYVRTPEELTALYLYSVGRGANLLVNIAPDRRGLLPAENVRLMEEMKNEIRRRYTDCVLENDGFEHDEENHAYVLCFDRHYLVDTVILSEENTHGEKIRSFSVYASQNNREKGIKVYSSDTVGRKHICSFPPVRASRLTVVIEDSDDKETLTAFTPCYHSGKQPY